MDVLYIPFQKDLYYKNCLQDKYEKTGVKTPVFQFHIYIQTA